VRRLLPLLSLFVLPVLAPAAERPTDDRLTELATDYALKINSTLLQYGLTISIQRIEFPELWEKLGAEVMDIRWSSFGMEFHSYVGIYRDDKLFVLAPNTGGRGLMSGVISGGALYFTFSWGENAHRSQVGRLEFRSDQPDIALSGGFSGADLFVDVGQNGAVNVHSGRYQSFNSWTLPRDIGTVRQSTPVDLVVVGSDGKTVEPDIAR